MKKLISIMLSFMLLFALTGCINNKTNTPLDSKTNSETTKKEDISKYQNYAPPANMPVYPEAVKFGEVEVSTYAGFTYLAWYYKSTASANELVEFYTKEFEKLGLYVEEFATYVYDAQFGLAASKDAAAYFMGSISFTDTEDLSNDVDPDTPNRHYKISINIDQWK